MLLELYVACALIQIILTTAMTVYRIGWFIREASFFLRIYAFLFLLCNGSRKIYCLSIYAGWSTSIFYTLTGSYDNTNTRLKKNVVGIHSVHIDISSKTHNLKFSKFLLSKKLNSKLGSILAQNSTYNFEAV